MAGRALGLHRVRARRDIEPLGAVQGGQATPDQQPVAAPPVLACEQDRRAVRADTGWDAGGMQLHQRYQPVHLDLRGCLPDQAVMYGVIANLEALGLELPGLRRPPG